MTPGTAKGWLMGEGGHKPGDSILEGGTEGAETPGQRRSQQAEKHKKAYVTAEEQIRAVGREADGAQSCQLKLCQETLGTRGQGMTGYKEEQTEPLFSHRSIKASHTLLAVRSNSGNYLSELTLPSFACLEDHCKRPRVLGTKNNNGVSVRQEPLAPQDSSENQSTSIALP